MHAVCKPWDHRVGHPSLTCRAMRLRTCILLGVSAAYRSQHVEPCVWKWMEGGID